MLLRPAKADDREALVALYRQGFGPYMRGNRRRRRWGEARAPWEEAAFRGVVVAELSDEVVGFACGVPARNGKLTKVLAERYGAPWLADDPQYVTAVTVAAAHRRKGIAAALIDVVVEVAEVQGATGIFAECVDGSGSPELFQRLGFLPLVTTRDWYPNGASMTVVAMPLPRT